MKTIHIHLVLANSNEEKDQIRGIAAALLRKLQGTEIKIFTHEYDTSNPEYLAQLKKALQATYDMKHILLCTGEAGITALNALEYKRSEHSLSVLFTEQVFDTLAANLARIDILALPRQSLTPQMDTELSSANTLLVSTLGVPHHLTADMLRELQSAQCPINTASPNIVVLLGGDNVNQHNKLFFTPVDATALADEVAKVAQSNPDASVVVLNNPTTGKYDVLTEQENVIPEDKPDPTTDCFLRQLQTSLPTQKVQFLDHRHTPHDTYRKLFAASINTPQNIFIITGDATMRINEACDLLSPKQLYIAPVGNMNEVQRNHIQSIVNAGTASLLPPTRNAQQLSAIPKKSSTSAASQIADSILQKITQTKSFKINPWLVGIGLGSTIAVAGILFFGLRSWRGTQTMAHTPTPGKR